MVKQSLKIVWLGTPYPESAVAAEKSLSAAAATWQRHLLNNLLDDGHRVITIGHLPSQLFPKGPLRGPCIKLPKSDRIFIRQARYWNLPLLRFRSLAVGYKKLLAELIGSGFRPDIIGSYNAPLHVAESCRWARHEYGIPWISFMADMKDPGKNWSNLPVGFRDAYAHIFFSHKTYVVAPVAHKYHFFGGFDPVMGREPKEEGPRDILYAGGLDECRGISMLLDAFLSLNNENSRLIVCGKGQHPRLSAEAARNPRIIVKGFVDSATLEELCESCSVFVNPRSSSIGDNDHNFPSKLLYYLRFGKPVVSSWTPSLPPSFSKYLIVPKSNDCKHFSECIDDALSWNRQDLVAWYNHLLPFVESNSWTKKTRELVGWITEIIKT